MLLLLLLLFVVVVVVVVVAADAAAVIVVAVVALGFISTNLIGKLFVQSVFTIPQGQLPFQLTGALIHAPRVLVPKSQALGKVIHLRRQRRVVAAQLHHALLRPTAALQLTHFVLQTKLCADEVGGGFKNKLEITSCFFQKNKLELVESKLERLGPGESKM